MTVHRRSGLRPRRSAECLRDAGAVLVPVVKANLVAEQATADTDPQGERGERIRCHGRFPITALYPPPKGTARLPGQRVRGQNRCCSRPV